MESAGIPDVRDVWLDEAGGANLLFVVSIKQGYPGHAFQAAFIASQCGAVITLNRYVVVVDDDINPSDRDQVLWGFLPVRIPSDPSRSSTGVLAAHWTAQSQPIKTGTTRGP